MRGFKLIFFVFLSFQLSANAQNVCIGIFKETVPQFNPHIREEIKQLQKTVVENIKGVSGVMARHIGGTFQVVNEHGRTVDVTYIGSLHDWENQPSSPENYFSEVSSDEKAFIDRQLPTVSKISASQIFVEQGYGTPANDLRQFLLAGGFFEQKKPKSRTFYTEFSYVYDKANHATNFDLRLNRHAPRYLIDCLGKSSEDVVATAASDIRSVDFLMDIVNAGILEYWLKDQGLPTSLLQNGKIINLTNSERDAFMALQILKSDKPVVIVAHTAHALGIIGYLSQRITYLESKEVSVSQRMLNYFKDTPGDDPRKRFAGHDGFIFLEDL